jgi:hypothetical protein
MWQHDVAWLRVDYEGFGQHFDMVVQLVRCSFMVLKILDFSTGGCFDFETHRRNDWPGIHVRSTFITPITVMWDACFITILRGGQIAGLRPVFTKIAWSVSA